MTLRTKTDRFVYTKAGEKISGPAVMQYLGKSIPSCYVSGDAVGVIPSPIPFDMNTDNMLPSNMAYMAERYLKGDPLTMALVFSEINHDILMVKTEKTEKVDEKDLVYDKVVDAWSYKINLSFLSPGYATRKVVTHGAELLKGLKLDEKDVFDFDLVYGIWDKLMFEGLKGMNILKVTNKDGVTLSVDAPLANQYFLTKTAIRAQGFGPVNKAPSGLNLVK